MRKYITVLMIALGLFLGSSAANAFDYKDWIPLLPESIGGMEKQGDPDGMNMEKGGQSWSSLAQKYSDAQGNDLRLVIVTGSDAPGLRQFETMQKFNMETEEKKVKTVQVSGHKGVLDFNKKGGSSNLLVAVQDESLVIIETSSLESEDELVSLADDVPISDIADSID